MNKLFKNCCLVALGLLVLGLAEKKANAALTVVGNWEGGANDGWSDWIGDVPITDPSVSSIYSFSNTIGVTNGSSSLHVTATGYTQDLSIKLQMNPTDPAANHPDMRPAFFTNQVFAVDITYPAQTQTTGYQQIYGVALNTQNYGFVEQGTANPLPGTSVGYGGPTPVHTYTLALNYASHLDVNGGPIITSGASADSYVEYVMATNSDSLHPDFYFDNARFYTPGDMNNDGHVNAADIKAMQLALTNPSLYQTTYFNGNTNYVASDLATLGDMNGDGQFTGADVQALLNTIKAGHGSVTSVPEPASILLLALAIPATFVARRRLHQSR
jgi:hypothetical protein